MFFPWLYSSLFLIIPLICITILNIFWIQRRDEGSNAGGGRNNGRGGRNDRGGGGGYDRMGPGGPRNGQDYGGGAPGGGWGPDRADAQMEVTFVVPSNKCGVIIGKGGETIKQINQQSGAHCELDRRATGTTPGSDKTFVIRGSPDQVENCKRIISEKVQMVSYYYFFYIVIYQTSVAWKCLS